MTETATHETHEVTLAVYDLSQGMARSLSTQFLGPSHAIDIIPHTGIVVYGREYYFGGGIQSCSPDEFRRQRGISPVWSLSLGRTAVSRSEFERWCASRTMDGAFAPEAYDLLRRNCNNFSHAAATAGLRLTQGVPDWILEVPDRFLSSPMGQMVRPMLDGMQVTGPGVVHGGGTFMRTPTIPPPAPAAAPNAVTENPWAKMSAVGTTPPENPVAEKMPVLDSYDKPLFSSDTSTIPICVSKIGKSVENEQEKCAIEQLGEDLAVPNRALSRRVLEASLPILLRHLDAPSASAAFALMLLRLVALRPPADAGAALELKECAVLIGAKMVGSNSASAPCPLSASHAARSMAWCALANAAAAEPTSGFLLENIPLREGLVDTALSDMSPDVQPRAEVRQSAAAFVYNVAHGMVTAAAEGGEGELDDGALPDLYVSLLCGALEGMVEEANPTTRLRKLLIVGKILCSSKGGAVNGAAQELVADLGFTDAVSSLKENQEVESSDAMAVKRLADELLSILSQ